MKFSIILAGRSGNFPIVERSDEYAARVALGSAKEARNLLHDANKNLLLMGRDPFEFGVALHVGNVVRCNIGPGGRLAYTKIGSAVTEVAQLEALKKTLEAKILMSGEFKSAVQWAKPYV